MLGLEAWPSESDVELTLESQILPSESYDIDNLAWYLIDPEKGVHGEEVKALLIARRAVAAAPPADDTGEPITLAWALYKTGRLKQSLEEKDIAFASIHGRNSKSYKFFIDKLVTSIAEWQGLEIEKRRSERDQLALEVDALDAELSRRSHWDFQSREDAWWNEQLSRFIDDLKDFEDPVTGIYSSGVSLRHGWGVRKRLSFVASLREATITRPDAASSWTMAIEAIASSDKYAGVRWPTGDRLTPQLGLIPIGPDATSGLWEFAHLATGTPATRQDVDGALARNSDAGVVLVLVPGGTFWMGAQSSNPKGQNYDKDAETQERPVREMNLAPYFISKYELTQGQWLHITGENPSNFKAGSVVGAETASLLHPVENVSWDACADFVYRVGLSLPTEAQWENAARAGTNTPWSTGEQFETLNGAANLDDRAIQSLERLGGRIEGSVKWNDGFAMTAPVGSYRPNQYGLHDVHGNVYEWCRDAYGGYALPVSSIDLERIVPRPHSRVSRSGGFGLNAMPII